MNRQRDSEQRGQALVMFALFLAVLLAGTALVVDVGFACGQRRSTQNAADASAEAGAVVLAENLLRAGTSLPLMTDAVVRQHVDAVATENVMVTPVDAE